MTRRRTAVGTRIRWISRDGARCGWVCIMCSEEWAGDDHASRNAAEQHDCRKVRILREITRANTVIEAAGAVRIEADGFQWVDTSVLPAEFGEYYADLTSTGYALGALP